MNRPRRWREHDFGVDAATSTYERIRARVHTPFGNVAPVTLVARRMRSLFCEHRRTAVDFAVHDRRDHGRDIR